MEDYLILYKEVDMSVLREGFSIPAAFQPLFYEKIGFKLEHGEKTAIKIMINGELHDAELKNQSIDREKYREHQDLLQVRYSPGSTLDQAGIMGKRIVFGRKYSNI